MGLWGIVSINDAGQILATATSAVGIFFSPSDHNGIWAGRLEGVKGKGNFLPNHLPRSLILTFQVEDGA